ncbi:hypothetical protein GGR52DRAFT_580541 [Hypoxylon sp. FL1284]|nr:hypothetical protein GGR52DRAFT_580541 [Hypoxylon sp. FL1284]
MILLIYLNYSTVYHFNVFKSYICASILKPGEGYTPAYTLKCIAIQMLSFFSSDRLEQYTGGSVNLDDYTTWPTSLHDTYRCNHCRFGFDLQHSQQSQICHGLSDANRPSLHGMADKTVLPNPQTIMSRAGKLAISQSGIYRFPDEILLEVLEMLSFNDLTNFAAAWQRISIMIKDYDVVRQRELQCFCLKEDYRSAKLGVGVSVNRGALSSEFDLLSEHAYKDWGIRSSINNLHFQHWLPLPISHPHWRRVKDDAKESLGRLRPLVNGWHFDNVQVIFNFMNDIVVRLNQVPDQGYQGSSYEARRSNLRHASEKAIDSYFHLFHLLVCMATEQPSLVNQANLLLRNFMDRRRSKTHCLNLGHLLIALLISDVRVTQDLIKSIITEAIMRNVVWLFDRKGANMPELSYMETDPVSTYRLEKTFEGSRTSYRLLMFSELFRRTARPSHEKPLSEVRDELFARHGAPPRGAAQGLATTVRRLHLINDFPSFLREMGLSSIPSAQAFTTVLRDTVYSSMDRGYSRWAASTQHALLMRARVDPDVTIAESGAQYVKEDWNTVRYYHGASFFPPRQR